MAGGAVAAVAAAIGVIIALAAPGSSQGAGSPRRAAGAPTVQRRNLVQTDTEAGTLGYADPQTVFNRVSGTLTWLPAVGQVIAPGQTLYEVDNQPVVLFSGSTPAFRDLSAADSAGPDILELNRDLIALGFDHDDPIAVNDTWQSATTAAVERWQGSLGETETGTITLGQVVFLPGAQRVTAVNAVLGSSGGSGGAGATAAAGTATGASTSVAAQPEFVSLTKTTTSSNRPPARRSIGTTSSAATLAELKALTALLKAETQELRAAKTQPAAGSRASAAKTPARTSASGPSARAASAGAAGGAGSGAGGSGGGSAAGGGGTSAQAIMQTSSTQLVVTVDLDASKQSEAVIGEPVTVQMPNGSIVDGRISAVSPVAQTSSSSSSAGGGSAAGGSGSGGASSATATVPVTVTLPAHLPATGLDQAAVSVNFEQQVENNVLSVPVTALLATQGGGYAVQEAAPPHRLLPVAPGLFAAGYVQVSGGDIYPGLQVTDSQG